MSALEFNVEDSSARLGLKGPGAPDWLAAQGIALPGSPNSWVRSPAPRDTAEAPPLLVARLGQLEFFLEQDAAGTALQRLSTALGASPPGVYPVLREDFAFQLSGEGVHDALAQVCNVNFAALNLDSRPVIMTLMIGVAVLVVPEQSGGSRRYRFWCDPTFGPYLSETLGAVVVECGGITRGVSA
jgi:sarcosine oxidase, subunit gamma